MKMRPESERPYEKCLRNGPEVLSDSELLAVILRTGTKRETSLDLARRILSLCRYHEGLTGILHLSAKELQEQDGIGPVKAVQILCIGELSRRIARETAERALVCSDPETVADYYMESLRHEEQEKVFCMMLDTKNHFLGDVCISTGTVNTSLISPREVFIAAVQYHAVHLILIHNHPSGDPGPSTTDLRITERVARAGELLGITLVDHIIIGDRCYVSLRREGILKEGLHTQ